MMRYLALLIAARLTAQVPAEVTGHVTARSDGHPIANARVEDVTTDERGLFVLHGLLPGRRTLRVRALGYEPASVDIDVANGRTTTVDFVLVDAAPTLPRVAVVAAVRGLLFP